jgi:hypothetical protein
VYTALWFWFARLNVVAFSKRRIRYGETFRPGRKARKWLGGCVAKNGGKKFEARRGTLKGEDGTDRGVLIVHTGADTGNYQAASVPDKSNYKGPGFGVGFPNQSETPYASPLTAKGNRPADRKHGHPSELTANDGHTEPGMSGGPMYTASGQVYSLDEGNDGTTRVFDGVPLRAKDVARWKEQLPKSWS